MQATVQGKWHLIEINRNRICGVSEAEHDARLKRLAEDTKPITDQAAEEFFYTKIQASEVERNQQRRKPGDN